MDDGIKVGYINYIKLTLGVIRNKHMRVSPNIVL